MKYEFNTDYVLEDYILNTKWSDLPENIRDRAIGCGIDLMTALILGSRGRQFAAGRGFVEKFCGEGDIEIPGSKKRYNLFGATVALGHSSNSFDIDDGHNMIKGHPGTSFVGGLMASALYKNLTWREYLTSLVIGYEVTVREALAEQDHYQFLHSTGTYGAFGTAAMIGRNLGFTREQLNNALSVAEYHAPLTPVMHAVNFPSMNKDGAPFGALVGAAAALDTLEGETGVGHILEMPKYRSYLESLGERYEIMNLYFKPFTCCRWAHQPIQAIIDLEAEHGFGADDVEEAWVHTFDSAAQLSKIVPHTTDEAQYNIAWPVASAIVHGDVGIDQIIDEALDDPAVLAMMKRLHFDVDPEMEAQFPAKRLAWVEIQLKDGRNFKSKVYAAPGEHTDNISRQWLIDKFIRRTASTISGEMQQKALDFMQNGLDRPARELIAMLNEEIAK